LNKQAWNKDLEERCQDPKVLLAEKKRRMCFEQHFPDDLVRRSGGGNAMQSTKSREDRIPLGRERVSLGRERVPTPRGGDAALEEASGRALHLRPRHCSFGTRCHSQTAFCFTLRPPFV
jgi:hypothetical protein